MTNIIIPMSEITTEYEVSISYRDGGNWIHLETVDLDADDLDDAMDEFESIIEDIQTGNGYDEGEYHVTMSENDGPNIEEREVKHDPIDDRIKNATILYQDEGEYSKYIIAIDDDGEYFATDQNGGSKGAHSRQEGDGRWSNMADDTIEEIDLIETVRLLIKHDRCTIIEACDKIADAHPTHHRDRIIEDIIDHLTETEAKTLIRQLLQ